MATYKAKPHSWDLGMTKTGKEQIVVSFQLPAEGGSTRLVYWQGFFTEATVNRTIESLRYLGFEGDDVYSLVGGAGALPNEVEIVTEMEEYEGKQRERVQWINRAGRLVAEQLAPDKGKALSASLREKFKVFDAENGKRVNNKPAAAKAPAAPTSGGPLGNEPPPLTDADIPF